VFLCREIVEQGDHVLIFCASKQATITSAQLIARLLGSKCSDEDRGKRNKILEGLRATVTGLDPVLAEMVAEGVAYHNAGLTVQERELIEAGYRTGVLKVLVSPSLSMCVCERNIRALVV
jgi:DNA polymerase theta